VILATGARLKTLGIDGEERLQGRRVSHCASCDAPLMRDRTVGVIGGGDSALQEALTLAEAVGEVIVLHRGDALDAQATYQRRALEHSKITIRYGTIVEEILGEDAVSGVPHARRRVRRQPASSSSAAYSSTSGCSPTPSSFAIAWRSTRTASSRPTRSCAPSFPASSRRHPPPRLARAGGHLGGRGATRAKAAHRYLSDGEWAEGSLHASLATGNGGG
jgi:hypothetical protein